MYLAPSPAAGHTRPTGGAPEQGHHPILGLPRDWYNTRRETALEATDGHRRTQIGERNLCFICVNLWQSSVASLKAGLRRPGLAREMYSVGGRHDSYRGR